MIRTAMAVIASLLLLLGFGDIPDAYGQDAARCVSVGGGSRSQTLRNSCSKKIEVVWCHNSTKRGSGRSRCGRKGKHYQQHRSLEPGERYENQYSLPSGARISYGACYGGYYSTKVQGRSYTCKTARSKSKRSDSYRKRDDSYRKRETRTDRNRRQNDRRRASRGGDAKSCVSIGGGSRSQTLRNTCGKKIEVVWCHNSGKRGSSRSRCSREGKYYQQHRTLEAGERYENQYSLPSGARISYGACYGGYYSTKVRGRSYSCK